MASWVDWGTIDKKYPSKLDRESLGEAEYRKQRTLELYDFLPQTTLEERRQYIDIRDAIIEMNYTFFGYIASHKFVNNTYISYEDKFQAALLHFCEMWEKYKFITNRYRTDVAFGVFFKPRITECMERDFDEVKYSLRRALCIEVGKQLGKHWAKVTYDDLSDPRLDISADKIAALQAIFGTMYVADLEVHSMFIKSEEKPSDSSDLYSDNYDSITDLLIHEMVEREKCLDEKDLLEISDLLSLPIDKLKEFVEPAKEKLHKILLERVELDEAFN